MSSGRDGDDGQKKDIPPGKGADRNDGIRYVSVNSGFLRGLELFKRQVEESDRLFEEAERRRRAAERRDLPGPSREPDRRDRDTVVTSPEPAPGRRAVSETSREPARRSAAGTSREPHHRDQPVSTHASRRAERGRERDSSPTALSQSSAVSGVLEWDHSADVGTAINPTSPGNIKPALPPQAAGMSTLDKLAFNLAVPTKPTGNLLRSHSEDNTTGETPAALARRAFSMTILELGAVGFEREKKKIPVPVYDPMKEMMANYEAQGRSKDSISTVIQLETGVPDPPDTEEAVVLFSHRDRLEAALGTSEVAIGSLLTEERGPRSIGYQSGPPRSVIFYSSNSVIQPAASTGYFGFRDEEPIPIEPNEPEPPIAAPRGASDASTDWEYGHSRSHSQENVSVNSHENVSVNSHENVSLSPQENPSPPVTDWQRSGLTRSELEYSKRINTMSSRDGSQSIEIEVQVENLSRMAPKVSRRGFKGERRTYKSAPTVAYERTSSPILPRPMSPMHGRRSSHPLHYHESPDEDPQRRQQYRDRGEPSRRHQNSGHYRQQDPRDPRARNHAQTETDGYDDKSTSSDSNEDRRPPRIPVHGSSDVNERRRSPPIPVRSPDLNERRRSPPIPVKDSFDLYERRRAPPIRGHSPELHEIRRAPPMRGHSPDLHERRRDVPIRGHSPDFHERRRDPPIRGHSPDFHERRRDPPIRGHSPDLHERRRDPPIRGLSPDLYERRRPQPNRGYSPPDFYERRRSPPIPVRSPEIYEQRREQPIPAHSSSDLYERRRPQRNTAHSSSDFYERSHPEPIRVHDSGDALVTSSSGMSATCRLIDRLVKSKGPTKDQDMMRAIYSHRTLHIDKVKKELHRLERLNNVLSRGQRHTSSEHSNSLDEGVNRKPILKKPARPRSPPRPKTTTLYRRTPSPDREHRRAKTAVEKRTCGVRNEVTNTSRIQLHNTGTQVSQPSLLKAKPILAATGTQVPTPEASTTNSSATLALEQKMDQLLGTFNFIADVLCMRHEAAADAQKDEEIVQECPCPKKKRTPKKQKPPKPAKPPVSYFIPFSNCRGEQMYLQYGRQRSPPSLSSSEKENEDHGSARQGKRGGSDSDDGRDGRYNTNEFLGRFSLQQIFQQNNPQFINRIQQREAVLSKLKAEREQRQDIKRQWIQTHGAHELSSLERALEPREPRLMSGREMRQITKKKYTKLPEVQEKKLQKKAEEEKRTNRLMSNVFAKKLRQGVLRGNVNMDMSKSIIANATFR